jgi:hypothetical protein
MSQEPRGNLHPIRNLGKKEGTGSSQGGTSRAFEFSHPQSFSSQNSTFSLHSRTIANHTQHSQKNPPKSITMAKTKKSGDTLASRLALVMKSGKGEFLHPSPKIVRIDNININLQLPWVPSPP